MTGSAKMNKDHRVLVRYNCTNPTLEHRYNPPSLSTTTLYPYTLLFILLFNKSYSPAAAHILQPGSNLYQQIGTE